MTRKQSLLEQAKLVSYWDHLPDDLQRLIYRQSRVMYGQDCKAAHRAKVQSLRASIKDLSVAADAMKTEFYNTTREMILLNRAGCNYGQKVYLSNKLNQRHIAILMLLKDEHALAAQELIQAWETLKKMGRPYKHVSYWSIIDLDPTPLNLRRLFLHQMEKVVVIP